MKVQLCHYAGCSRIAQGYYCPEHKAIQDKKRQEHNNAYFTGFTGQRGASRAWNDLYHSARWKREKKVFLESHYWCVWCGAKADTVDHIKAHKGNETLFWDVTNWQAMCHSCHSKKSMQERRQKRLDR